MRLSLRFIIPLAVVLAGIAYAIVPLVDQLTFKWFVRDLEIRSALIANAVHDPLADLVRDRSRAKITRFFDRIIQDERLYALGFCDLEHALAYKTQRYPDEVKCRDAAAVPAAASQVMEMPRGALHVAVHRIEAEGQALGSLVLIHDMSFVQRRSEDTKKYVFYLFVGLAAVISLVTVVVAQLSWRGWMDGLRAIISGEGLVRSPAVLRVPELRPIARDLRSLIRDLESDRRTRDESQMSWTPDTLRAILREELKGDEILIVSNREPYLHNRRDDRIVVSRPASGLVTALEPVLRACSGTWVAHGSGSADRETVDANDHVMVPPEKPAYRIRRVWLTKEEEAGYYYGFSNEGMWPLCHIAHTRPAFRSADWEQYTRVNGKFADAVVQEAKTSDPIILVQDYHLALLPRLIRERLSEATIITFWHIPWPNPEIFGICPWREAILEGMLGSSILGFHTQSHCNNFFDTADRFLEARVDRETFTISYGGQPTSVHRYPISIEWPPASLATQAPVEECRAKLRRHLGVPPDTMIGVGVDRLDYTKGILERFMAVERLLEREPKWIGRFVFLQIAAPSRSSIDEYQHTEARVRALARRVNDRFSRNGWQPISLNVEHHEPDEIYERYRAADVCVVTSLHDGMNLVAKEFIASRDDERGALVLSQFAGAARELAESLIVNPYDIDECATALERALTMPAGEQRDRMRSMRSRVQEFNVYRWAGRMLLDAANMRRRHRLIARSRGARLLRVGKA